jgi:hypothetical protein
MQTSDSIKNIAPAFVKFQKECPAPKKTAENSHIGNSYAPLDAILEVVQPVLSENGLSQLQEATMSENMITVRTILMHETGEFFEFEPLPLPMTKNTAQQAGSAISYARRYALCAALGIMAENDDDGNEASQPQKPQGGQRPQGGQNQQRPNPTAITTSQKTKIGSLIKDKAKLESVTDEVFFKDHLQKAMNTKSPTKNWSKAQASQAITLLENWGKNKEGQA